MVPRRPESPLAYVNEQIPDGIPRFNQGRIPVIVRLVHRQFGEEYRPAVAIRWTTTHVKITIENTDPDTSRPREKLALLREPLLYAPVHWADQAVEIRFPAARQRSATRLARDGRGAR